MSSDNERRGNSARGRADAAAERVRQIGERLRQLRAGEPSGDEDVQRARHAAVAAASSAVRQYAHSRDAHLSASRLHDAAAAAFDQAGQHDCARRHREAAAADADAAVLDDQAAGAPD